MEPAFIALLDQLVAALNVLSEAERKANGWVAGAEPITWMERKKYVAIDIGSSGAWLVEKETGELYNISGYGVPDRNKKVKANLGNIATVDPAFLYARRYNYLR